MAVGVGDSDSGLPWGVALSLTLRFWVAVPIYENRGFVVVMGLSGFVAAGRSPAWV